MKDSTKNEGVGEVIWHSLNESGETKLYDVRFKRGIIRNIPRGALIPILTETHHHEVTEEDVENLDDIGLGIEKDAEEL